jgi:hypothetical protein
MGDGAKPVVHAHGWVLRVDRSLAHPMSTICVPVESQGDE